jgi:hypothetical protein
VVSPPLTEGTDPLGAPAQEALPTGTVLESRFRVVRMLGRGGMGEVYEAVDVALGARIAVKTVRLEPGSTEARLQRFRREILLARKISHPNVCRVFELHLGSPGEPPLFLSMELLEGETLAERLRKDGPLPEPVARELVTQIASGVAAAHRGESSTVTSSQATSCWYRCMVGANGPWSRISASRGRWTGCRRRRPGTVRSAPRHTWHRSRSPAGN